MAVYRFNEAAQLSYEFFWNDICDWYIEASKQSLYSDDDAEKDRIVTLLVRVLEESLRLLHPFMSFITEEIYQQLPEIPESTRPAALIAAEYPTVQDERRAPEAALAFASLQELVRLVRTLRSEFTVPPSQKIRFAVRSEIDFPHLDYLRAHTDLIQLLTTAQEISFGTDEVDRTGSVTVVGNGFEAYVYVRDAIDLDAELKKLRISVEKTGKLLQQSEKKLGNPGFLNNASDEVVEKERRKRDEFAGKLVKLREYLDELA